MGATAPGGSGARTSGAKRAKGSGSKGGSAKGSGGKGGSVKGSGGKGGSARSPGGKGASTPGGRGATTPGGTGGRGSGGGAATATATATWGEGAASSGEGGETPVDEGRRSRRGRRAQPRGVVRSLAGLIVILVGVGGAVAVDRNRATSGSAAGTGPNGGRNAASSEPTTAEIAASEIAGEWAMTLVVVQSTGFFGTQVGKSVDKTYTITPDCSVTPCLLRLAVSGAPGEFALRKVGDDYVLSEAGPQDCIDLATNAVRVPNGGVASVVVHLRPTSADRTQRGGWAASSLTGSVVTTFDTSAPECIQGPGVQRSTAVGTRR